MKDQILDASNSAFYSQYRLGLLISGEVTRIVSIADYVLTSSMEKFCFFFNPHQMRASSCPKVQRLTPLTFLFQKYFLVQLKEFIVTWESNEFLSTTKLSISVISHLNPETTAITRSWLAFQVLLAVSKWDDCYLHSLKSSGWRFRCRSSFNTCQLWPCSQLWFAYIKNFAWFKNNNQKWSPQITLWKQTSKLLNKFCFYHLMS